MPSRSPNGVLRVVPEPLAPDAGGPAREAVSQRTAVTAIPRQKQVQTTRLRDIDMLFSVAAC